MKTLRLSDEELQVINAMVNGGQWAIAKHIVSLQEKCAAAIKDDESLQDAS